MQIPNFIISILLNRDYILKLQVPVNISYPHVSEGKNFIFFKFVFHRVALIYIPLYFSIF